MIFKNKTLLTVSVVMVKIIIIFIVVSGFKRNGYECNTQTVNTTSGNISFKLPDEFYFAGERMPLENFDTRESLDREIQLTAYRHSSTIMVLKRANRYLPLVERILKEYDIPDDFKFLIAAESEFANVVSPVGAAGFWQIMPATGREQGLEINNNIDERYNLEKATRFACVYIRTSYERYGSWTLAAASYNSGRGRIDERIRNQRQTCYYDMLFVEETARFVFRVAAYKLIMSDPAAYGFNLSEEDLFPPLDYHEIRVNTAIRDLVAFADSLGTNYKILRHLNPWLRQANFTPQRGKSYTFKIPVEGMRTSLYN